MLRRFGLLRSRWSQSCAAVNFLGVRLHGAVLGHSFLARTQGYCGGSSQTEAQNLSMTAYGRMTSES